jgi:hypothetical protein
MMHHVPQLRLTALAVAGPVERGVRRHLQRIDFSMADHVNQHFVPRFLLARWESSPDQKLTSYRWEGERLIVDRYKAKSVGKEAHLYSLARSQPEPEVQIERELMGPHIDDPAAVVLARMLDGGIQHLEREQRLAWSPFVLSMMFRNPRSIQGIRTLGSEVLTNWLE